MSWLTLTMLVGALAAQQELSLADAARMAASRHPAARSSGARAAAAEHQIEQARSGYLPKLNYAESYQRSDNPVFVFSTLLLQRRFAEENFAIGRLNRPGSVQNFQSLVTVDQTVFDGGVTRHQTQAAQLRRRQSEEEQRLVQMQLMANAAAGYFGVLLAEEALEAAREAVGAAQADLSRAEAVRAAGMATDADVLSLTVHLAAMREQEIRRQSELDVARAALNEALGAPLDTSHRLTTPLAPLAITPASVEEYEKKALRERPELRQADLSATLAATEISLARAANYPQLSLRGAFEADRGRFVTEAGVNWFAGVTLKWNLFNGYADRSRVRESSERLRAAQSDQQRLQAAVQLEVRRAFAALRSATERIAVAETAVAQAEESLRITRNRYENGLATVTDLLRNQTARHEAILRRLTAVHDQRVAAAMLELAAASLTPDSEVLR